MVELEGLTERWHSCSAKQLIRGVILISSAILMMCQDMSADNAVKIPSSPRSRKAIERVMPDLIRDMNAMGLHPGAPIFIRIFKVERELELWVKGESGFELFRTYPIVAMSGGPGPKQRRGDNQAPEGFYHVTPGRMNPASNYHLSFDVGYPNAYDRALGRTGSLIMVHGDRVSIGCFAMTDEKIEEIFALADAAFRGGQPFFRVHAFPFRMTESAMAEVRHSEHFDFWTNLKEGYDFFERDRLPPDVTVREKRYVFGPSD